jgi:hypothetical protein
MAAVTWRSVGREVAIVVAAVLLYFAVRNVTAGGAADAFANASRLLELERELALGRERSVQAAIAGSDALVTLANWIYIWGHWPVIVSTGIALFLLRRDRYYLLRNALILSGAIGFLFFALFPVAPPRLLGLGLIDTVSEQSSSYRALQPPGLTNQFAAFPSLHAGWNLLVGIVLFGSSRRLLVRAFGVLSPLLMAFAVVATANHFVVDVAGGFAVVLLALAAARAAASRAAVPTLARRADDGDDDRDRGPLPVRRRTPRRQPTGAASRG